MFFSESTLQSLNHLWFPVSLYAFATSASPGPVNIVAVSSGVTYGLRKTLSYVTGAMFGFATLLFAVGTGLGQLFNILPWILLLLKGAGSIFLCYLAYRLFQSTHSTLDIRLQRPPSFQDGALAQWLNPKAWIVAMAGTATYTVAGTAYYASLMLMIGLFMVICFFSIAAWAVLGVSAKGLLRTPRMLHHFNRLMAVFLLFSIIILLT